jgi:hypothetical protein
MPGFQVNQTSGYSPAYSFQTVSKTDLHLLFTSWACIKASIFSWRNLEAVKRHSFMHDNLYMEQQLRHNCFFIIWSQMSPMEPFVIIVSTRIW